MVKFYLFYHLFLINKVKNMKKNHHLRFCCLECQTPIQFSVFEITKLNKSIICPNCHLNFDFSDEVLKRQIEKFEALCNQIKESEEILSNTSVGIFIGDREVKIPYKLLLTRLNSTLDLVIGDRPLSISFRSEPILDH